MADPKVESDAGVKALRDGEYAEAAQRFLNAFVAKPTNINDLLNCGASFWLGAKHYLSLAGKVTVPDCNCGAPEELFLIYLVNPAAFPGGLLANQIRGTVSAADRKRLAECLKTAEACFRRAHKLGEKAGALIWRIALTRGTGRFDECRELLRQASNDANLPANVIQEASSWVDGIQNYQKDLGLMDRATEGWVVPRKDRLLTKVLDQLAPVMAKVQQSIPVPQPKTNVPAAASLSIKFQCVSCGKTLTAPKAAVGKSGKCSQCGHKQIVPQHSTTTASSQEQVGKPAKRVAAPSSTGPADVQPETPVEMQLVRKCSRCGYVETCDVFITAIASKSGGSEGELPPGAAIECCKCAREDSTEMIWRTKDGKFYKRAFKAPTPEAASLDAKAESQPTKLELLVQELMEIGKKRPDSPSGCASGFGVTRQNTIGRNERAIEIGEAIDEIGGFDTMLETHGRIKDKLGSLAARELEAVWGGIGAWQA